MKAFCLLFVAYIFMPQIAFNQAGPISLNTTFIDDDDSQFSHDNSQGDGDNQIAAGEKIRFVVKLKNAGTLKATNVIAAISCDNPDIIFSDAEEEYKDIEAGAIVEPYSFWMPPNKDGGFLFAIKENCPTTTVHFTLRITASNCGPYEQTFDLPVQGGTFGPITIAEYKLDDDSYNFANDSSQGDGNGKIDPGETIGIDLALINNGSIPAVGYTAKLHLYYPGITVLDSVLEYSVLKVGRKTWTDDYDFGYQFQFHVETDIISDTIEFSIGVYNSIDNLAGVFTLSLFIEKPGTILLELDDVSFDDDQEYYTNHQVIGNGNQIMEPRETVEVTARLKNNGTGSALEVKAILQNSSPYLVIVDSVEEFATIRSGYSASPEGFFDDMSFIVKILNTAPTSGILCPIKIITKYDVAFYDTLIIPVDASASPPPGAVVILTSPENGDISADAIITVKGYVDDPLTRIFLNGDSIKCADGSFLGYVMNRRGNNLITIRGITSTSKEDSVTINVIGQPYDTFLDKARFYLHTRAADKCDYNYLSEYAPYHTTSEVTYYPDKPDSMEWLYPLDFDIGGDQYSFSLLLSSLSSTLYTSKILVRNTREIMLASCDFNVSSYATYEKTVTGEDPSTGIGDTLIFRLCWNKHAHFWLSKYTSDIFGGSLSTSVIYIPSTMQTSIAEFSADNPVRFKLMQNYPNPFNSITSIVYELPENSKVEILIYNVSGKLVRCIQAGGQTAGIYSVNWDGMDQAGIDLPGGLYFCKVQTDNFSDVIKMILKR